MTTTSARSRVLTALAVASLSILALAGCATSSASGEGDAPAAPAGSDAKLHDMLPKEIQDAGVIRNAAPAALPPYAFKKDGTTLTGIVPELSDAVGKILGVKFEVVDTPFPGIIPALKAHRADVGWTTMTDSVKREAELDFVNYFLAPAGFMVVKGNPKGIESIDDICGLRLGTLRGNSKMPILEDQSKKCVAEGKKPVEFKLYDETGVGQTQLRSGNIDMWFGGVTEQQYLADSVDNGSVFEVTDARVGHTAFGVGVLKGNDQLAKAIQAALQETVASGTYDEILKKWNAESGALKADGVVINGASQGLYE